MIHIVYTLLLVVVVVGVVPDWPVTANVVIFSPIVVSRTKTGLGFCEKHLISNNSD